MAYSGPVNFTTEQAYPTPFHNSTFLPVLLLSLASVKHTPTTKSNFKLEYDYIVIGSGSGGSVVASRLSEVRFVSVLLLEAGKSPPLLTEVPAISKSFFMTDIDWQYKTELQNYTARIMKNRKLPWTTGKDIGGSSVINNMLYLRGNAENYNDWEAQGAKGWSWRDALPYFKKAEDNRDPRKARGGNHGVGGPMTVGNFGWPESAFTYPLLKAQSDLGYRYVDPNGVSQTGVSDYQGNIRRGQRCSAAKAYLVPAENRTNLDIVAEAFVTQILIKNKTTYGVHVDFKNSCYEIIAKREVILSAGTVNSAQLLMLSGIGPKKTLKKFRIPVIADLPVGQNFHSHGGGYVFFSTNSSIAPFAQRLQETDNIQQYIYSRSGILASSGLLGLSFLKDDPRAAPSSVPDFQLFFVEGSSDAAKTHLALPEWVYQQFYAPYENKTTLWCVAHAMHPRSRGYVTIQSSDPYDKPIIQPNYLKDPQDLRDIIEGMKTCHRILESPELKGLGVRRFVTLIPGCEDIAADEDKYLECSAGSVFSSGSQAGTAKMGNTADPTTVVDPKLRVKGIRGLRVVDASVIPTITTGPTSTPVIMIAEKASDVIKKSIFNEGKFPKKNSFGMKM